MERALGLEPRSSGWKPDILPIVLRQQSRKGEQVPDGHPTNNGPYDLTLPWSVGHTYLTRTNCASPSCSMVWAPT